MCRSLPSFRSSICAAPSRCSSWAVALLIGGCVVTRAKPGDDELRCGGGGGVAGARGTTLGDAATARTGAGSALVLGTGAGAGSGGGCRRGGGGGAERKAPGAAAGATEGARGVAVSGGIPREDGAGGMREGPAPLDGRGGMLTGRGGMLTGAGRGAAGGASEAEVALRSFSSPTPPGL